MIKNRLERLRKLLSKEGADSVLISKEVNLHYFSGFTGDETYLLITPNDTYLITDARYTEQAEQETDFTIIEHETGLVEKAISAIKDFHLQHVAFEGKALSYDEFAKFQEALGKDAFSISLDLDVLRVQKDAHEIELIKKAIAISDAGFKHVLKYIKPGVSEIEVAAELEDCMRRLGSERPAFPTIIASGERGSLPHGMASDKLIREGEFVTMDFGAVYKGYHSDITRTVCVGKATEEQKKIYNIVLKAQLMGVESIECGKTGKEIDAISRRYIAEQGYGANYGHGLGHGVGLEIHELPRLSPRATFVVDENMIVTSEPGIYIKGFGGVRIEDTVLVTKKGGVPLTQSTKELIEL